MVKKFFIHTRHAIPKYVLYMVRFIVYFRMKYCAPPLVSFLQQSSYLLLYGLLQPPGKEISTIHKDNQWYLSRFPYGELQRRFSPHLNFIREVKVLRVFPSGHRVPHIQGVFYFKKSYIRDIRRVVTPFMQDGIYPTRNFATFGPSEYSRRLLKLFFIMLSYLFQI